ncbi:hypothetical protein [Streptomyces sp. NPDC050982]|uniref:hypothetical protein n=1 Tax=Streptomyces sp. NPDC050982 TaxID=3154746 RepID=UPI0033F05B12
MTWSLVVVPILVVLASRSYGTSWVAVFVLLAIARAHGSGMAAQDAELSAGPPRPDPQLPVPNAVRRIRSATGFISSRRTRPRPPRGQRPEPPLVPLTVHVTQPR